MKFALTMIICSILYKECTDPYEVQQTYDSYKECLLAGYEKSAKKIIEIDSKYINTNVIHIKFNCQPYTRS